jgi:hypothetical protein
MWRFAGFMILACCGATFLTAQPPMHGCTTELEFAPKMVRNVDSTVTFVCDRATPMNLIRAVGRQTRIPIGIVVGEDPGLLSKPIHSYHLEKVDARSALQEAIQGTGYALRDENPVLVLIAGDLMDRQMDLLTRSYSDFRSGPDSTMVELGVGLTMWMEASLDRGGGFGASIGGSTNDERVTLGDCSGETTEQIANKIVSLGSKGMWIFKTNAFAASDKSRDEVVIEPYQHYSNKPNIEH